MHVQWLRYLLSALLLLGLAPSVYATDLGAHRTPIAIIIDDMGNQRALGLQALELPGSITYAFLPHTPYAVRFARLAHLLDREIMLHLPMETEAGHRLGPGGLTSAQSQRELLENLRQDLQAIPHIRGVNNHMGSLLTQRIQPMRWVMEALQKNPRLFFVDSRTSPDTVAGKAAVQNGIPTLARDIFLDHVQDPTTITHQFQRLIALAKLQGGALAIGHAHPETLAVLETELRRLDQYGVQLVSVSRLLALGRTPNPSSPPQRLAINP